MSFPKFVSTARTVELSAPLKHIKQLRRISQYDSPFFQSRLAGALGVGACLGAAFLTSPIMNYSRKVETASFFSIAGFLIRFLIFNLP
jgi:hypothetical protein